LHGVTSHDLNALEGVTGRQVWFNFWDTKLTRQHGYLARLNYVHQNAVKHGLVRWRINIRGARRRGLSGVASATQVKTIYGFKIDRVKVYEDF